MAVATTGYDPQDAAMSTVQVGILLIFVTAMSLLVLNSVKSKSLQS
jgi:hypothetical protein